MCVREREKERAAAIVVIVTEYEANFSYLLLCPLLTIVTFPSFSLLCLYVGIDSELKYSCFASLTSFSHRSCLCRTMDAQQRTDQSRGVSSSCSFYQSPPATAPPPPPPSSSPNSRLSLEALVRVTTFFPHGVPLCFAAVSPLARMAAETYRAEENYRWTANDGLVQRLPGERETFDVYEARRYRRAGVQIGRLITVYHDCTGHVCRASDSSLGSHAPMSSAQAVMEWERVKREQQATDAFRTMPKGVRLLREENDSQSPVFAAAARERSSSLIGSSTRGESGGMPSVSPSGGDMLQSSTPAVSNSNTTSPCSTVVDEVLPLTGPNSRSVYIWMSSPILHASSESNNHTDRQDVAAETYVHRLVSASRWWLQRPAVSSLRYLEEEKRNTRRVLLPPPPPAIHLHVYGQSSGCISAICRVIFSSPSAPAAAPASVSSRRYQQQQQKRLEDVFGAKSPYLSSGSPETVVRAPPGSSFRSTSTSRVFSTELPPTAMLVMPQLVGLHVIGYPLMSLKLLDFANSPVPEHAVVTDKPCLPPRHGESMDMTPSWLSCCTNSVATMETLSPMLSVRSEAGGLCGPSGGTVTPLQREWLCQLRVLKFHGVRFNDGGLRRFLAIGEESSGSGTPSPRLASVRGVDECMMALTPVIPFLEVCDVGHNLELTVFPLIQKEYATPHTASAVQRGVHLIPVISLRHLRQLNLQSSSTQQGALHLIALCCPALASLYLGCCSYVTSMEPLGLLPCLRQLDLHATGVTDEGVMGVAAPWSFPALEELSLASVLSLTSIEPLGSLSRLTHLDLRLTPVKRGFHALQKCGKLTTLLVGAATAAVPQTPFGDAYFLRYCRTLSVLHLDTITFDHQSLEALAFARAPLASLSLHHVATLDTLTGLTSFPLLRALEVNDAPLLTGEGFQGVGEACPLLATVVLSNCPRLFHVSGLLASPSLCTLELHNVGKGLFEMKKEDFQQAVGVKGLQVLRMAGLPKVMFSPEAAGDGYGSLPQLVVADCAGTATDDEAVQHIASTCVGLEALFLGGCTAITKVSALMHLPLLHTLDLSGTGVIDGGIAALRGASALHSLCLDRCASLQFVPHTGLFSPALRKLSLQHNPQLNTARLQQFFSLADECPEKLDNPFISPLPYLQELYLSHTSVDSIYPLIYQQQLEHLDASHTPLSLSGITYLSELASLQSLCVCHLRHQWDMGSLYPLFTHPCLSRVELTGTKLGSTARTPGSELPTGILADSPTSALYLSATHLTSLMPLLQDSFALPQLQLLVVHVEQFSDAEASVAEAALPLSSAALVLHQVPAPSLWEAVSPAAREASAALEALLATITSVRPLLSIRRYK